jgi:hypothetical protein
MGAWERVLQVGSGARGGTGVGMEQVCVGGSGGGVSSSGLGGVLAGVFVDVCIEGAWADVRRDGKVGVSFTQPPQTPGLLLALSSAIPATGQHPGDCPSTGHVSQAEFHGRWSFRMLPSHCQKVLRTELTCVRTLQCLCLFCSWHAGECPDTLSQFCVWK